MISRILSAALVGYHKIWQSNLLNQALGITVTGLLLLIFWSFEITITLFNAAILYGVGRIVVTIVTVAYWHYLNKSSDNLLKSYKPTYIGKEMVTVGFPLLIVSASLIVSTSADTLMLGWLDSATEVGLYTTAAKLALMTSFVLQIAVSAISPKIATMYANDEIKELELLLQRVNNGLILIGLFSLVTFILFGKVILGLWGEEFKLAYPILVVLSLGQFFNIASGPVGNILVMTDNEKLIMNITSITVCLNLILNYFLIEEYGGFGAAIATSITTFLNMAICYFYVKKRLGINIIKFY